MKKSTFYLILAVIWALGACAWIANVICHAGDGTLSGWHIVAAVSSAACVVLDLFIFFRARKKGK